MFPPPVFNVLMFVASTYIKSEVSFSSAEYLSVVFNQALNTRLVCLRHTFVTTGQRRPSVFPFTKSFIRNELDFIELFAAAMKRKRQFFKQFDLPMGCLLLDVWPSLEATLQLLLGSSQSKPL